MAASALLELPERIKDAAHRHVHRHSSKSESKETKQEQAQVDEKQAEPGTISKTTSAASEQSASSQQQDIHLQPTSSADRNDHQVDGQQQMGLHLTRTESNTPSHSPSRPSLLQRTLQRSSSSISTLPSQSSTLSISDFDLLKTLGTGTFARVWLARLHENKLSALSSSSPNLSKTSSSSPSSSGRVFALKVLRKSDVIRLKQVEHIQNERATLGLCAGHPFITTLVGTFRDKERVYMMLEYCPGGELFTYLRARKRFDEPTARFYIAEIVLVLEFLHEEKGVVYRDLKPENILLDRDGHVKLVDFGFAKRIGSEDGDGRECASGEGNGKDAGDGGRSGMKDERETYTLCGTPEYLAPEVIKNTGHGTGADWWALGILLYEFLYSQPPFWSSSDPMRIYSQIVNCKSPISIPSSPTVSRPAKDLLIALIEPRPSERMGVLAGGAKRVKEHKFFERVDWQAMYERRTQGPIVPNVKSEEDAECFEEYGEEDNSKTEYGWSMRHKWDKEFEGF